MRDYSGDMASDSTKLTTDDQVRAQAAEPGYTRTAIALHWIAALLIVCNLTLGISMINGPLSPLKLRLFLWHKGIGITVFLTASARLLWRALYPAPAAVPMS